MTVPDFQTLMRPLLAELVDRQPHRVRDLTERMSDLFELTEAERVQMLPSGRARLIVNRVGWAVTHMAQAGVVHRPQRGHLVLTDAGADVLATHPERVDMTVLSAFAAYRDFRGRTSAEATPPSVDPVASTTTATPGEIPDVTAAASPQDLLAQAVTENRAAVEGELLDRALALTPTDFERLVLELLRAMGYGRAGQLEHSGASGDGGIDGIISQDPLGLDRIYLQAKRYAAGHTVGRPELQGFVGALASNQGDRGVFITTSTFTKGALETAERVSHRIELVDGGRLAALMLRHGVGVQAETTVTLHRLDEDFFEAL
ncbi:restriction endonuclease [Pseudokineococcus basanitobsidens]|uniref:Restriction endonuclease n=1 Tax=Pseudokineococcus basanitobsidens TaxID=1926649 RepID=A0ABU8RKI1_9ACTN